MTASEVRRLFQNERGKEARVKINEGVNREEKPKLLMIDSLLSHYGFPLPFHPKIFSKEICLLLMTSWVFVADCLPYNALCITVSSLFHCIYMFDVRKLLISGLACLYWEWFPIISVLDIISRLTLRRQKATLANNCILNKNRQLESQLLTNNVTNESVFPPELSYC